MSKRQKHSQKCSTNLATSNKLRKYTRKQPWTHTEDAYLTDLVKANGLKRWSIISSLMSGRSAKQCRERWKHQLDPKINTAEWTIEEGWFLYLHHAVSGNKWTYLSIFFPGRTDNSIKNHWNTQMKKRFQKYQVRLENAISLFRSDEIRFNSCFNPNEIKLIEKISNSIMDTDAILPKFHMEKLTESKKTGMERVAHEESSASLNLSLNLSNVNAIKSSELENYQIDQNKREKFGFNGQLTAERNITRYEKMPPPINNSIKESTEHKISLRTSIDSLNMTTGPTFIDSTAGYMNALSDAYSTSNNQDLIPILRFGVQIVSPCTSEFARLSDSQIFSNFMALRAVSKRLTTAFSHNNVR